MTRDLTADGYGPGAYVIPGGVVVVDPSDPAFNTATGAVAGELDKPVIYLFSNARDGDGIAYAMAEDGTVVGSHWCSATGYMQHDLHDRDDGARCKAHYPEGYRLVVLALGETPPPEVYERNQAQRAAADAAKAAGQ